MRFLLHLTIIIILILVGVQNKNDYSKLEKQYSDLENKYDTINMMFNEVTHKYHKLQKAHKDHLSKCAMIDKNQLRYGYDNVVYIRPVNLLVYDSYTKN